MGDPVSESAQLRTLMDERDLRYQQRFEAQSSAINAALQAAKEAVTKAEASTEKRFESVNEFRGALQDAAKNQITRGEVEAWREQSRESHADLVARVQRIEGKSLGLNAGWGYIVAAIAIMVGIATVVIAIFKTGAHQ